MSWTDNSLAEVQVTNGEVERARKALEEAFTVKPIERLMRVIEFWLPDSVGDQVDMPTRATMVAKLLKLLRCGLLREYSNNHRKLFCEGKKFLNGPAGRVWMEKQFLPKVLPLAVASPSKKSKTSRPATPTTPTTPTPAPTKLIIAPSPAETQQDAALPAPTSPTLPSAISPSPLLDSTRTPCAMVEIEQGGQRLMIEEPGLCVQCWTIHSQNRGGPFISLATPATIVDEVTQQRVRGHGWRRRIATSAFVVSSAAVAVAAWYLRHVSEQPRKSL